MEILFSNEIRITKKCNLNCLFCNSSKNIDDYYSDGKSIINKISKISQISKDMIIFTGKEPTLEKNLLKYIKYSKKIGFKNIQIQTNAMVFNNPVNVIKFKEAGLTSVMVSFLSIKRKVYDYLTQSQDPFQYIVKGIKNLLKEEINVSLNIVINQMNYKDLLEICKYISFIAPTGSAIDHIELIPKISEIVPFLKKAMDFCIKKNMKFNIPDRCGIPFCLIKGYEKFHKLYITLDYKDKYYYNLNDFIKFKDCNKCKWDSICIGIWKKYTDIYGFAELKFIG